MHAIEEAGVGTCGQTQATYSRLTLKQTMKQCSGKKLIGPTLVVMTPAQGENKMCVTVQAASYPKQLSRKAAQIQGDRGFAIPM